MAVTSGAGRRWTGWGPGGLANVGGVSRGGHAAHLEPRQPASTTQRASSVLSCSSSACSRRGTSNPAPSAIRAWVPPTNVGSERAAQLVDQARPPAGRRRGAAPPRTAGSRTRASSRAASERHRVRRLVPEHQHPVAEHRRARSSPGARRPGGEVEPAGVPLEQRGRQVPRPGDHDERLGVGPVALGAHGPRADDHHVGELAQQRGRRGWSASLLMLPLFPSPPSTAPSTVATKFSRSQGSRSGAYAARSASSSRSDRRPKVVTPPSCRAARTGRRTGLRPRLPAMISLDDLAALRDTYRATWPRP